MRLFIVLALTFASALFTFGGSLDDQLPEKLIPGMAVVIDAAMEQSSTMSEREWLETEAKGRRIASRSFVLPRFSTNVSYYQEDDIASKSAIGYEERLVYSVMLQQPLYHWGARSAEKEIGKLQYDAEILNTATISNRLLSDLRNRYMALVLAKLDLEIKTVDVDMKRREFDTQEERSKQGLVSPGAMYNIQLSLDKLELTLLQSESNWDDQLHAFVDYSGVDQGEVLGRLVDEIPLFEPLSPETIEALGSQLEASVIRNESVLRQVQSIEVSRKQLDVARVALRPKLDVVVGMSQNARDLNGVRREQEYLYGGIKASWNIFDGFQTRGRKVEAIARLHRNEELKNRLEAQLQRSGKRALFALEIASRWLSIQEEEYRVKTNSLSISIEDFEAGRISDVDAEKARQKYRNVTLDTQKRRVAYLNALSAVSILLEK